MSIFIKVCKIHYYISVIVEYNIECLDFIWVLSYVIVKLHSM